MSGERLHLSHFLLGDIPQWCFPNHIYLQMCQFVSISYLSLWNYWHFGKYKYNLERKLYTLFFIRTCKIQLRLWMFFDFCHLSIFDILKISFKNKAICSNVLRPFNPPEIGAYFDHYRNFLGGTWSKTSQTINQYLHFKMF